VSVGAPEVNGPSAPDTKSAEPPVSSPGLAVPLTDEDLALDTFCNKPEVQPQLASSSPPPAPCPGCVHLTALKPAPGNVFFITTEAAAEAAAWPCGCWDAVKGRYVVLSSKQIAWGAEMAARVAALVSAGGYSQMEHCAGYKGA
jgi:hypothetical protein